MAAIKCKKTPWRPRLHHGLRWGSLQHSPELVEKGLEPRAPIAVGLSGLEPRSTQHSRIPLGRFCIRYVLFTTHWSYRLQDIKASPDCVTYPLHRRDYGVLVCTLPLADVYCCCRGCGLCYQTALSKTAINIFFIFMRPSYRYIVRPPRIGSCTCPVRTVRSMTALTLLLAAVIKLGPILII